MNAREVIVEQLELSGLMIRGESGIVPVDATVRADLVDLMARIKKPPKASQFEKGRSGNPKGRPRKDPGIAEIFRKVSKQVVLTTGPKGRKPMTKIEATITQLMNKSVSGDLRAVKILMTMASQYPDIIKNTDLPVSIIIRGVSPSIKS